MPIVPFTALPGPARVWVLGAAQPVLGRDAEHLLGRVESFVRGWLAHGEPVVGGCDWRYDRFLLLAADEDASGISGCSIDALFRVLKEVESELGVSLLDSSLVFFRDPASIIQALPRREFRELVVAGDVGERTIVFDNTVGTVGGIRSGQWERPFRGSWQERAFRRLQRRNA
jgi:hypothetical protein